MRASSFFLVLGPFRKPLRQPCHENSALLLINGRGPAGKSSKPEHHIKTA